MGKFLESLRHTTIRPSPTEAPIHRNGAPAQVDEVEESVEEIPFIEVGPHKSMEASASVLATRPRPSSPASAVTFHPSPAEAAPRRPHFAPEIVAYHQPDHPISAQYRDLLTALLPAASHDGAKALLFVPALAGVDVTAVVLNLAVAAGRQENTRVVIVDAGAPEPALAERLGLAARPGVGEVLSGAVTLEQALLQTDLAHLAILPAGAPATLGLRLVVETPGSLLRKLRKCCDLIFVLGPPSIHDSEALAKTCDVVYLVLPEREAGSPQVDELLRTFPQQGARLGGCILAAS
jgi:Mrp family chromosome partitioning ATPase